MKLGRSASAPVSAPGRPLGAAAAMVATVVTAVVVLATATGAAAQNVSHSTQNASGVESPIGGIVFLGVSAVIAGTALILYLRHRTPRPRSDAASGTAADATGRPTAP